MLKHALVPLWRNHRGSVMVEMAAILPFLMVLGCGVFEFGAFFYQYQMVEAGLRDAARYMARVTDTTSSLTPCDPTVLASKVANAKDIAVMGVIGGTTKRVSWWNEADVTVDYATIIANPMISGYPTYRGPRAGIRIITVSTSASYPGVGFLSFLGLSAPTISLSHQERCIGEG